MVSNDWKEKAKKLNLEPLGKQVVVSIDEMEQVKGGIIIPDTSQEHPRTARVMFIAPAAVEESKKFGGTGIAVGDHVLVRFFDHMKTRLTYDGPEFCIMDVCGLVCKLKD
jgi:chaperonin GroES